MMEPIYRPTKEQIRDWLRQRQTSNEPPPEIEQIQRILGWKQPEMKRQAMKTPCA